MSTKKNVMIKIFTTRMALNQSLFAEAGEGEELEYDEELPFDGDGEESETSELWMEGRMVTGPERVELVYEESELSGMEGSVSTIGFDRSNPGLVSMIRTGLVSTALVFEEGKRHICVYHTPFSEFEVCAAAKRVENRLLTDGVIELDYVIEVHGAQAERCRMTISVHEVENPLL